MYPTKLAKAGGLAALVFAFLALAVPAGAVTYPVGYQYLVASTTVGTPLADGDTLLLDTVVTTETGALSQEITFTTSASANHFTGFAAWMVTDDSSTGPRLVDVNIDIFDASNNLVVSDTFTELVSAFAHSELTGQLDPGTYRLVVTGNAVRDSVLDVAITFAPEPGTATLLLSGLALAGFVARERRPRLA